MALSLPQVVDNIARIVNNHEGKEENLDRTIVEVWQAVSDLTRNLSELGKLLRFDRDRRRVHSSRKNVTTYQEYDGVKQIVRESIETLMNYAVVVGQDTLLLLENMWAYFQHLDKNEPDEFAYRLVDEHAQALERA